MNFSVVHDLKGFDEAISHFSKDVVQKSTVRTSNVEGKRFTTHVVKKVREEYSIKASRLKSYISIDKADMNNLVFSINIKSNQLSLSNFSPRTKRVRTKNGRRIGVTVKVKKKFKRKLVRGAFLHNGQIYKRKGANRLPLKSLKTLSAPQMFKEHIVEEGLALVEQNYAKTFASNLNYYSAKKK